MQDRQRKNCRAKVDIKKSSSYCEYIYESKIKIHGLTSRGKNETTIPEKLESLLTGHPIRVSNMGLVSLKP